MPTIIIVLLMFISISIGFRKKPKIRRILEFCVIGISSLFVLIYLGTRLPYDLFIYGVIPLISISLIIIALLYLIYKIIKKIFKSS